MSRRKASRNAQNTEVWGGTVEDHVGFHSRQPRTWISAYHGYGLTQTDSVRLGGKKNNKTVSSVRLECFSPLVNNVTILSSIPSLDSRLRLSLRLKRGVLVSTLLISHVMSSHQTSQDCLGATPGHKDRPCIALIVLHMEWDFIMLSRPCF